MERKDAKNAEVRKVFLCAALRPLRLCVNS